MVAAGNSTPFVVAIDGPAASGKGTIAKRLATEQQLAHLDTGLLYRGVGWAALSANIDLSDEQALADLAAKLNLAELESNKQLRGDQAAVAASKVSALPAVRATLLQAQRKFATDPPAGFHGSVLDGRDVGTVVCPDAAVKLYVTADVEVRAQRRLDELHLRGASDTMYEEVLADMKARDARDMGRAAAPLKPADDALVLDTTLMSIDAAFEQAVKAVEAAKERQIQEMLYVMLGIYSSRGHEQLSKTFDRFKFNCIFDLPLFFCRGADRMRVLSNLLSVPFDKVTAEPKLVSVQMLDNRMGRIDLEATLHFHPRARWLPFASLIIPESLPLHGTWTIVATGDDDKIISVTETWHNVPGIPRLLRALLTTAITSAGLAVNGW
ncbi:Cytidylate kinase-domain-containing protein [Scenedesmus sp. NREL 46B-D3]|nr:Cytidylate kinase-domain-containing protein [Scenedesmus sp. NREL 46B-D3]